MQIKKVNAVMKQRHEDGTITKKNYPNINPEATGIGVTFAMSALNNLSNATLLGTEVITVADAPVSLSNSDANASITFPENTAVEFVNAANNCTIDASSSDSDPEHAKVIFTSGESVLVYTSDAPDYVCSTGDECTINTGFGADTIINAGDRVSIYAVGTPSNDANYSSADFSTGTNKHIENSGNFCTLQAAGDIIYIKNSGSGSETALTFGILHDSKPLGTYDINENYAFNPTIAANEYAINNSGDYVYVSLAAGTRSDGQRKFSNSGKAVQFYNPIDTPTEVTNSGDFVKITAIKGTVRNSGNYVQFGNSSLLEHRNASNQFVWDARPCTIVSTGEHCEFNAGDGSAVTLSGGYNRVYLGGTDEAKSSIVINSDTVMNEDNRVGASCYGYATIGRDYTSFQDYGYQSRSFPAYSNGHTIVNAKNCSIYASGNVVLNGNINVVIPNNFGNEDVTYYGEFGYNATITGSQNTLKFPRSIDSSGINNNFIFFETSRTKDHTKFNTSRLRFGCVINNLHTSNKFVFGDHAYRQMTLSMYDPETDTQPEGYSESFNYVKVVSASAVDSSVLGYYEDQRTYTVYFAFNKNIESFKWKYNDEDTIHTFYIA